MADREERIRVSDDGISAAWAPFSVPVSLPRGAAKAGGGAAYGDVKLGNSYPLAVIQCTVAVTLKSTGENVTLEHRSRSIASVGARRSSALWRQFYSNPCVYLVKLESAHCRETALALVVRTARHKTRRKRSRQPTRS